VSASGGTGPYTYAWAPTGGTGITGTALIAGPYTVTVTDANGCTTTATTTITEPPVLTATAAFSPVLCFGDATGSATCTPVGGVGPYAYAWTPAGGNGPVAPNLTAQSYTCTVTDQNGCTTTASVTVTEPPVLAVTASSSPVLCFGGATGSASSTPTGGTGAYTYNWTPSGGNAQNAANLTAGPYTIIVTDANGCTASAVTTVTEPTQLTATTSFTQSTCGQANGSAAVAASGGSPVYTYSWSPVGGTNATATSLLAQAYTCLITDNNGCSITASVTVPNAGSPTVTIVATDSVSCFGGADGFAAVQTSGGTTPYTYLWSNGDADTLAGNLAAGSYTVTVTDANGCSDTAAVIIGEPPLLTITATATDVLCFGGATGTAASTAAGGTGAYAYNWTPSGGTADSATGLTAQVYTVTVTDANGCTASAIATVSEPPLLTLTATFTPVTCNGGSDGTVSATAGGGLGTYTYDWQPGSLTNSTESNLPQGVYTCTVTDQNGCTATASTTITEPTAVVLTTSAVDAHCNQSDGSVSSNATGGTGTITYQWTNAGGPATFDWNNIPAATYTVVATDQNGCTDTATQVVQNLNGVNATLSSSTNLTCFNAGNGAIDVDATGGTGPYTYAWNPNAAVTTDTASGLSAGQYTITVTDASGCTSTVNVLLTEPSMLTIQANANPTAVCEGTSVQLSCNAGGGTPAYQYGWLPGPLGGQTHTVTPLLTTTYTAVVTDNNGCTASSTVTVTVNPMPAPVFQADVTQGCAPVCVNFSDLTTLASGTITGWSWDFGDNTTSTQQNPPQHCYATPGVYTVVLTVTTNAGCTQTITMANYITVFANPVANFGASPQPTTMINPTIQFTDSSILAASWMWSFGDVLGSSSTVQHPSFTYSEPTCYLVQLDVTSADGCTAVDTQTVCIGPDVSIYVPNTFTPDGNGQNDIFNAVTTGMDPNTFELWIFDRWGNMIYYTDDINEGWDGRVQGAAEICQIDTYVWKIKCDDMLGDKHNLIGHVNLLK
jgi:gliding motility-associated-like protein